MRRIVFATGNEGKLREIRLILDGYEVVSMKDAGIDIEIEESGKTFRENAYIKARTIWEKIGGIVIADDSGLEVDYIGGEPGVYSARYMGENTGYDIKNNSIIERLKDARGDERSARFRACICAILEDGSEIYADGVMEGLISERIEGGNGFGYDPILFLPEYGMTSAQISIEEKNKISHRGKALRQIKEQLDANFIGK